MESTDEMCTICQQELIYGTIIVQNGLPALYNASISRNDRLHQKQHGKTTLKLHKDWKGNYIKASSITSVLKTKEYDSSWPSNCSYGKIIRNYTFYTLSSHRKNIMLIYDG